MVFHEQDAQALSLGSLTSHHRRGATVRLGTGGEGETELGAQIAARAFRSDESLVRLHQRFADGKTKTKSAHPRSGALLESIKDLRQRLGLDSQSRIGDLHNQPFIRIVAGRNVNLTVFRSELHRVVDQVPKDLLQAGRVGPEMDLLRREIKPEREMFSLDLALVDLQGVLQKGVRIDHLEVELDLPFADTGQIEQVVDQPRLQLDIPANHVQRFLDVFRQAGFTFQVDCGSDDRSQRRPQFVAEHGEELIFREVGTRFFLQLLVGYLQFLLTFLQFDRERLRLFEEILRARVGFDRVQDDANALGQLIEKSLVGGIEAIKRG